MSTGAQRQQRLKAKRQDAGIRPVRLWLSDADSEALKRRYPGPRGGIDWSAVVAAVLTPPRRSAEPISLEPNGVPAAPGRFPPAPEHDGPCRDVEIRTDGMT